MKMVICSLKKSRYVIKCMDMVIVVLVSNGVKIINYRQFDG